MPRTIVDDDPEFDIVKIIQREGWRVTCKRDLESLEEADLSLAHVVFVDIHGVGAAMGFANEGLGLAKAIKSRMPEKFVIIYSAQRSGDRFAPELSLVDYRLAKDAEAYEFLEIIGAAAKQAFDPDACIQRAAQFLKKSGTPIDVPDLERSLTKLASRRKLDSEEFARVLHTTVQIAQGVVSMISMLRGK